MLVESFSGIRGIYGKDLTDDIARRYSCCYAELIRRTSKSPVIVLGTDTRQSAKELRDACIDGLDCDIIDVGTTSTPAIEFAVREYKADGGIIITASHNEPEWNGFKFLGKDGAVLRPSKIKQVMKRYKEISKMSEINFLKKFSSEDKIRVKKIFKRDTAEAYYSFLLKIIGKENIDKIRESKLRIIIDPNGGTGILAKEILERIGVKVIGINMEAGRFARQIEPNEKSLSYLQKMVIDKKAALAAGFDCDADRMQVILKDGIVSGHYLFAMIADELLSNGEVVVVSDATSGIVKEVAEKHHAKTIEVDVGEINVVDEMEKNKAIVGGEGSSSGVIIPPSKCRDGILTLLLLLAIIAKKKKPLGEIIKQYPQYCTLTEKIRLNLKGQLKIIQRIRKCYSKFKITERKSTGAIKVCFDNSSFLWARASQTEEDVLRIMADSKDIQKSKKIIKEILT